MLGDQDGDGAEQRPGDDDPEPAIMTPPGGAPRVDDELEADPNVGTGGPRSAAEERTRAPRKRGAGKAPAAGKAGKTGKRGK